MTPSEIKPGMRFGRWTVIKFDHTNQHRIKYFLCKCDCGTERAVRGTALIGGTSTGCSKKCTDDLTGQTFGNWKVLKRDPNNSRNYICECSCGTVRSVDKNTLKNGKSKSCGCLKIQHCKENNEKAANEHIGEKYGKLTIVDYTLNENEHVYYYKCKCECGNETIVKGNNLFSGNTTSCGCINSKANEEMARILTRLNIPFKREYKFEDCKVKRALPFDFALFNNQDELIGLIENNGSQHYSSRGTGWNTPEQVLRQQKHDYIKQKFCEDNNIPLLIIPYQYFNQLEKFLTTSDFWQIIIKNFND